MTESSGKLRTLGVDVPEIFLPAGKTAYETWAVVACDQYSSEREYWESVKTKVGLAPSTLNLIFPECYLEEPNKESRIIGIKAAMGTYLASGAIQAMKPGFVLVERHTPFSPIPRTGLVISVDLERYEYGKGSTSLIRPTEGTIVERLPPRMQIRRGASLELPHIMLLIDDPGRTVIEPVAKGRESLPKLYDFKLMTGAGSVRGWHVADETVLARIADALERLADPAAFRKKYGQDDVLLFAVGDGNHSLATAKAIWEETKKNTGVDRETHPARFALVELVNIYDEGLPFHPIHRVLFNAESRSFLDAIRSKGNCSIDSFPSHDAAFAFADEPSKEHRIACIGENDTCVIRFTKPDANLAAGTIQAFLDTWLAANPGVMIDYIHGTESLVSLASKKGNVGLYLPPVNKGNFFGTVIKNGVMPRKTFSMGEAPEKRFYIEARRIVL